MFDKIKKYESFGKPFMDQDDMDYIIAVPSGEIIDMPYKEIPILHRIGLVKYDIDKTGKYLTMDDYVSDVRKFLIRGRTEFNRYDIIRFLTSCGLSKDHFDIDNAGRVDVYTSVDISHKRLFKIPYKFHRCTSDFNCSNNKLVSLENAPDIVHGNFNCSYNLLGDLSGGPFLVSKAYNCSNNRITILKGAPRKLNVFNCSNNYIKTREWFPDVKGVMVCNNNPFINKDQK